MAQMYADDGPPDSDIGDEGDFYLDQETGELYGPKNSDGWGDPGVVLMGEDGEDGEDGQDGQDVEDGSEINSGSGEPDAELGVEGDYYLNEDEHELYGPKTSNGWGSPLDLKGADGNANVTRYIFPGHDFRDESDGGDGDLAQGCIQNVDQEEMNGSAWLYYLIETTGEGNSIRYSVPATLPITGDIYATRIGANQCDDSDPQWQIIKVDGPPDSGIWSQIEIVQVESSDTEDLSKRAEDEDIIPEDLDVSNYDEVAEYYGFGGKQ